MEIWQPAYVGIGSNQQDPPAQVREAIARLGRIPRTRGISSSSLFGSKPLTTAAATAPSARPATAAASTAHAAPATTNAQPDYVNAVAGVLTQLTPEEMLAELKAIEHAMGRSEVHEKWGPRVIDLDLLVQGAERRNGPGLTLPHPGIPERNFVLYPLAEIAPDLEVPGLGRVAKLRERVAADGLWRLHETPTRTSTSRS